MSVTNRKILSGLVGFSCIVALGCTDALGPQYPGSIPQLSLTSSADLSGSLPVTDPFDPRLTLVMGTYAEKTLVSTTISGLISLTWRYGPSSGQVYALSDPFGMYHHGQSTCYMNVAVTGTGVGSIAFVPGPCGDMSGLTSLPDVGSRSTAQGYHYLNGEVRAARTRKWFQYSSQCDYSSCWDYGGTQSVDVSPIRAELRITANRDSINEGDYVTFTAAADPSSVGGLAVPIRVVAWRWHSDIGGVISARLSQTEKRNPSSFERQQSSLGSFPSLSVVSDSTQDTIWSDEGAPADSFPARPTTTACGGTNLTCTIKIYESGHMEVEAIVNSAPLVALSERIGVYYECPPAYYRDLKLKPFPARSVMTGPLIDSAVLYAPFTFDEYYAPQPNTLIPQGKYRPSGGVDSRGYRIVPPFYGYVVFLCRTWRTQAPDGTDIWHNVTEFPVYAGHHGLTFISPLFPRE